WQQPAAGHNLKPISRFQGHFLTRLRILDANTATDHKSCLDRPFRSMPVAHPPLASIRRLLVFEPNQKLLHLRLNRSPSSCVAPSLSNFSASAIGLGTPGSLSKMILYSHHGVFAP
ncbi:MAG: hypothetical protein LM549_12685, partial [Candidatus Competibacter sp.]|nr:hypothetical protein [Candidatus Competibacter sp.]